jgi:hypothetical protein
VKKLKNKQTDFRSAFIKRYRFLVVNCLMDDFAQVIGRARKARVIDIEHPVASTACEEDPVATIHNVGNDGMSGSNTRAESRLVGSLDGDEVASTESIDSGPHDITTAGIPTVALEPRVQDGRVGGNTLSGKEHSNRGHGTTSLANSQAAGTETLSSPARIALFEKSPTERGGIVKRRKDLRIWVDCLAGRYRLQSRVRSPSANAQYEKKDG